MSIEVPLDAEKAATARAKIRASIAELQAMARSEPVEVPVEPDVNVSAFTRAIAAIQARLGAMQGMNAGFPNLLRPAAFTMLGAAALSASSHVLTLAASLGQMVGVAGLLPGIAGAGAASLTTLIVGFEGFGAALGSMDDPEKFAAALENLAPAARDVASAIKDLKPALHDLRLDVQQRLFENLGGTIQDLGGTWIPVLRGSMSDLAGAMGDGFWRISQSLLSLNVVEDVQASFANTTASVAPLSVALSRLTPAFTEIGRVSTSFLPGLASGFDRAAERFAAFIERVSASGQLHDFIQGGIDAVGDFGRVLGNSGRILGGFIKAAQDAGGGTLGSLADTLGRIAGIVNGPAFQGALTEVFSGAQEGISALADSLPKIGDALVAIAPGLADLLRGLGGSLGEALGKVADLVIKLAPTFNSLADAFANASPGIQAFVGGLVMLSPIVPTVLVGLEAVVGFLAGLSTPVLIVVAAIVALVAGFALLWQSSENFRGFVGDIVAAIQSVDFSPISNGLTAVRDALVNAWAEISPIIDQIVGAVRDGLGGESGMGATFQQIADTIGLAMQFIAAQIQGTINVITLLWGAFGPMILGVISAVFGTIQGVVQGAMTVIQGVINTVLALISGDWSGAWEGIKQTVSGAWQVMQSIINGAVGAIRAVISGAWQAVGAQTSAAWQGIQSAIASGVDRSVAFVASLPGRAVAALGNLGGLLRNAGASLIQGLIDGIMSKLGAIGSAMSSVASNIKGFLPGSPIKTGPLKSWNNGGAGKRLGGLLIDGLDASVSGVAAAAGRMASAVSTGSVSGSFSTSGSAAGGDATALRQALEGMRVNLGPVDPITHHVVGTLQTAVGRV